MPALSITTQCLTSTDLVVCSWHSSDPYSVRVCPSSCIFLVYPTDPFTQENPGVKPILRWQLENEIPNKNPSGSLYTTRTLPNHPTLATGRASQNFTPQQQQQQQRLSPSLRFSDSLHSLFNRSIPPRHRPLRRIQPPQASRIRSLKCRRKVSRRSSASLEHWCITSSSPE